MYGTYTIEICREQKLVPVQRACEGREVEEEDIRGVRHLRSFCIDLSRDMWQLESRNVVGSTYVTICVRTAILPPSSGGWIDVVSANNVYPDLVPQLSWKAQQWRLRSIKPQPICYQFRDLPKAVPRCKYFVTTYSSFVANGPVSTSTSPFSSSFTEFLICLITLTNSFRSSRPKARVVLGFVTREVSDRNAPVSYVCVCVCVCLNSP